MTFSNHAYPQVTGNPTALAMLSAALAAKGRAEDAVKIGLEAIETEPNNLKVRDLVASVLGNTVPKWHVPMLRDAVRNRLYREALEKAVQPGMLVLEIGSGAGLLSLIAARAGAQVVTCDVNPFVAAAARINIERNGFSDRVTVVQQSSKFPQVGDHLPRRADLLVSELFDDTLFADGICEYVPDAKERLLTPEALVIPEQAELRCALVSFDHPEKHRPIGSVEGFDLSAINAIVPRYSSHMRAGKLNAVCRSAPASVLRTAFNVEKLPNSERDEITFISTGGRVDGIAQWLRIGFDEDAWLENSPFESCGSHWGTPLIPFTAALQTASGEQVPISIQRTDRAVFYELSPGSGTQL